MKLIALLVAVLFVACKEGSNEPKSNVQQVSYAVDNRAKSVDEKYIGLECRLKNGVGKFFAFYYPDRKFMRVYFAQYGVPNPVTPKFFTVANTYGMYEGQVVVFLDFQSRRGVYSLPLMGASSPIGTFSPIVPFSTTTQLIQPTISPLQSQFDFEGYCLNMNSVAFPLPTY